MDLNLLVNPFAKLLHSCTWCTSGSGLCGLSSLSRFPVATEEAPVKVSDSSEGLVADKRGVNSSVSLSLQGSGMTDHQRLEGHKTARPDITELDHARSTCHQKYCFSMWEYGYLYEYTSIRTCITRVSFYFHLLFNYYSRLFENLKSKCIKAFFFLFEWWQFVSVFFLLKCTYCYNLWKQLIKNKWIK